MVPFLSDGQLERGSFTSFINSHEISCKRTPIKDSPQAEAVVCVDASCISPRTSSSPSIFVEASLSQEGRLRRQGTLR